METVRSLEDLPYETLTYLTTFLSDSKDVGRLAVTSKQFYKIHNDEVLWRARVIREIGYLPPEWSCHWDKKAVARAVSCLEGRLDITIRDYGKDKQAYSRIRPLVCIARFADNAGFVMSLPFPLLTVSTLLLIGLSKVVPRLERVANFSAICWGVSLVIAIPAVLLFKGAEYVLGKADTLERRRSKFHGIQFETACFTALQKSVNWCDAARWELLPEPLIKTAVFLEGRHAFDVISWRKMSNLEFDFARYRLAHPAQEISFRDFLQRLGRKRDDFPKDDFLKERGFPNPFSESSELV